MLTRRTILKSAAFLVLGANASPVAAKPQAFDFAWLKGQAR
jgi:hypothetical protein